MTAAEAPSASVPQHDVRWKWLLLTLCALAAILVFASLADVFGIAGRPWSGWWDAGAVVTDHAFVSEVLQPVAGGAAAKAGLREGDQIDLREQTLDARVAYLFDPMAARPVSMRVHRGERTFSVSVVGSTIWEANSLWKITGRLLGPLLGATWFLACATLIAARRWWAYEARVLALAMFCQIGGLLLLPTWSMVVPGAGLMLLLYALSSGLLFAEAILLVTLSSRYGARVRWRQPLEWGAYAMNAVVFFTAIVVVFGIVTLRLDPSPYFSPFSDVFEGKNTALWSVFDDLALLAVALCALAAVLTSSGTARPRAAWLLLPLPLALFGMGVFGTISALSTSYFAYIGFWVVGGLCWLLGGLFVTYALLNRRVLDFSFVLNRAVVVSVMGLIVVIAFVLLEWILGSVLTGVSHATGLIANAALALVIGVSLNYIHRHVDRSVDLVLFRKRHENEKALLGFSKEAVYVTEWDALLDATLEKVRRHTDARSAQLLIGANGFYTAVRSFGGDSDTSVNENDEAILALKVWHKPVDPHHYDTALHAALALPMLARGKLYGVLLLGERAGGEAYAPDEVEALSQLANGVGSALEALSLTTDGSAAVLAERIELAIASLREAMVSEIRTLRTSLPT
ncbi:MAG: GAF domain-containing protein [Candidatus Eremiobacteraeota bacterium]|nr:GAF domain-containing protein [Candidatus Eremiobacteraeota bacterium]